MRGSVTLCRSSSILNEVLGGASLHVACILSCFDFSDEFFREKSYREVHFKRQTGLGDGGILLLDSELPHVASVRVEICSKTSFVPDSTYLRLATHLSRSLHLALSFLDALFVILQLDRVDPLSTFSSKGLSVLRLTLLALRNEKSLLLNDADCNYLKQADESTHLSRRFWLHCDCGSDTTSSCKKNQEDRPQWQ